MQNEYWNVCFSLKFDINLLFVTRRGIKAVLWPSYNAFLVFGDYPASQKDDCRISPFFLNKVKKFIHFTISDNFDSAHH